MCRFLIAITALALIPLATSSAGPPVQAGKIIDPTYDAWSRFPDGSAVTFTSVGKGSGGAYKSKTWWRIVQTTTLIAASPERIELRIETSEELIMNDKPGIKETIVFQPQKVIHHRLIDTPRPGSSMGKIVEQCEKEIKLDGESYTAKYTKFEETSLDAEGSVYTAQTWTSDDVPGGLIRREEEMDGTYWFVVRRELTTLTNPKK